MKYVILCAVVIYFTLFLLPAPDPDPVYSVEVTYFDGNKEVLNIATEGDIKLKDGCLYEVSAGTWGVLPYCGIRKFRNL